MVEDTIATGLVMLAISATNPENVSLGGASITLKHFYRTKPFLFEQFQQLEKHELKKKYWSFKRRDRKFDNEDDVRREIGLVYELRNVQQIVFFYFWTIFEETGNILC